MFILNQLHDCRLTALRSGQDTWSFWDCALGHTNFTNSSQRSETLGLGERPAHDWLANMRDAELINVSILWEYSAVDRKGTRKANKMFDVWHTQNNSKFNGMRVLSRCSKQITVIERKVCTEGFALIAIVAPFWVLSFSYRFWQKKNQCDSHASLSENCCICCSFFIVRGLSNVQSYLKIKNRIGVNKKAQIVSFKSAGNLSNAKIAQRLGISVRMVGYVWKKFGQTGKVSFR